MDDFILPKGGEKSRVMTMNLVWAVLILCPWPTIPYRTPSDQRLEPKQERQDMTDAREYQHDAWYPIEPPAQDGQYPRDPQREERQKSVRECRRCCDPGEEDPSRYSSSNYPQYQPQYQVVPHINITILKGEKGANGERGHYGKSGKGGQMGPQGPIGFKGTKGSVGPQGQSCKSYYAAFSVGRKKALHSNDYYQTLVFDTELVNLYGHFNMFTGKFFCYVPGIYFFSLNVHTWNQKETYLHIMHNEREVVILYAQPSDRSVMQSQSLMLELEREDRVWVRLFKGERENAVFSDDFDTYITFNGHLIKHESEE